MEQKYSQSIKFYPALITHNKTIFDSFQLKFRNMNLRKGLKSTFCSCSLISFNCKIVEMSLAINC